MIQVGRRLRDTSQSLYSKELLSDGMDRAVDRIKQEIPILRGMLHFADDNTDLILLPEYYHEMVGVYATKDAFGMDERLYEAQLSNNEFEAKLATLKEEIQSGTVTIYDEAGEEVLDPSIGTNDSVQNVYYKNDHYDTTGDGRYGTSDRDEYNDTSDGCDVVG